MNTQATTENHPEIRTEFTELQTLVLLSFATAFNYDSAEDEKEDNVVCMDVAEIAKAAELTQKQVKGVLGSLVKLGLIDANVAKPNGAPGVDQFLTNAGVDTVYAMLAKIDAQEPEPEFQFIPAANDAVDDEYSYRANPSWSVQVGKSKGGAKHYAVCELGQDDPRDPESVWLQQHAFLPTLEAAQATCKKMADEQSEQQAEPMPEVEHITPAPDAETVLEIQGPAQEPEAPKPAENSAEKPKAEKPKYGKVKWGSRLAAAAKLLETGKPVTGKALADAYNFGQPDAMHISSKAGISFLVRQWLCKEKGYVIAIDKDANAPEGGTATLDTKATPIIWMGKPGE